MLLSLAGRSTCRRTVSDLVRLTRRTISFTTGIATCTTPAMTSTIVTCDITDAVSRRIESGGSVIGTHDGSFHCDEALACGLLRLLPQFSDAPVVRSRKPALWEQCSVLVDVGAVHQESGNSDDAKQRVLLDHHQSSFNDFFSADHTTTKLSSAGLVYRKYGRSLLSVITGETDADRMSTLFRKVYDGYIEHIDAIDNGVEVCPPGCASRYHISSSLSDRVGRLNIPWTMSFASDEDRKREECTRFAQAMQLCTGEFVSYVEHCWTSWMPARTYVEADVRRYVETDGESRVLVMSRFCPWKEHLAQVENEQFPSDPQHFLYVVFEDSSRSWRVQAVSVAEGSFQSRKPLPAPWRGARDQQLDKLTGVAGGIFVHASGFIGGHCTRDGALQLAHKAVAFPH